MTSMVQARTTSDLKPGEQINNYLNRAAFALRGGGHAWATLTAQRSPVETTAFWQVEPRDFEARVRRRHPAAGAPPGGVHLFNRFNWGNPQVNFNSGQFGRITTQGRQSALHAVRREVDF